MLAWPTALDWLHVALLVVASAAISVVIQLRAALVSQSKVHAGTGEPFDAAKLLDFLLVVGTLKTQKRTGWVNHNVALPESISDHMYRLSVMGLVLRDPAVDRHKTALVGLVHDLAEAVVGDITPTDVSGVSKADKHALEVAGLDALLSNFNAAPVVRADVRALWYEYERPRGAEGKVMKQLDKLEMVIQAYEYELQQRIRLDAFFESTMHAFTHPEAAALHKEVLKRRAALHAEWAAAEAAGGPPAPQPFKIHRAGAAEAAAATAAAAAAVTAVDPTRGGAALLAQAAAAAAAHEDESEPDEGAAGGSSVRHR
jgi:putative hydrolase of HD superfamily